MKHFRVGLFCLALLAVVAACQPPLAIGDGVTREGDLIAGTGTIRYYDFEGGFYALDGDDQKRYVPMNLPQSYEADGVPVRFRAKIQKGMLSIVMAGPVIEFLEIQRR